MRKESTSPSDASVALELMEVQYGRETAPPDGLVDERSGMERRDRPMHQDGVRLLVVPTFPKRRWRRCSSHVSG